MFLYIEFKSRGIHSSLMFCTIPEETHCLEIFLLLFQSNSFLVMSEIHFSFCVSHRDGKSSELRNYFISYSPFAGGCEYKIS